MKTIGWMLLGGLLSVGDGVAQKPDRKMTKEEALEMSRTLGEREIGRKWFEDGDETGPYVHVGRLVLDHWGNVRYGVMHPQRGLTNTGLRVPKGALELRMDFFASEGGYGWVTTHSFRPEVESSRPAPKKDARPYDHRALAPAAELAIREGDLRFLKALMARGLDINEALDFKQGKSALYVAVWERQLEITKFLLNEGADPAVRTQFGRRPVDLAAGRAKTKENDEFLRLLAKPDTKEKLVDGMPEGMLAELFHGFDSGVIQFVSWGDKDPSDELLAWMRKAMPHVRPASRMETIERRPLGAHSWYRDKREGGFGNLLEVTLKPEGKLWKVHFRQSVGPVMAGGGWEGTLSKSHGYWHQKIDSGWDE